MHCYYCMELGEDVHAVALCRWCGGAACAEHVLEVRVAAEATVLLAPPLPRRRELVCCRCWEERTQPATPAKTVRDNRKSTRQREDALPAAADAVKLAEALLRGEYAHHQNDLWSRLQAFWALLACRLKLIRFAPPQEPHNLSQTTGE